MDEFFNSELMCEMFEENENTEDEQTIIKNNCINAFFIDKDITELVYLDTLDSIDIIGIFRYNEEFLYYDGEKWHTLHYETLTYDNKDESTLVKLMDGSSKKIEYLLHPFFTKEEKEVFTMDVKHIVDMTSSTDLAVKTKNLNKDGYSQRVIEWNNGYSLTIEDWSRTYVIKKDGEFVSGFKDDDVHFQMGDACTTAHLLSNGDLIVCNHGDVCSVVVIKFLE